MTDRVNDLRLTCFLDDEMQGPASTPRRRIGTNHCDDPLLLLRVESLRLSRSRLVEERLVNSTMEISTSDVANRVRADVEVLGDLW
jgi:hypothetical protein